MFFLVCLTSSSESKQVVSKRTKRSTNHLLCSVIWCGTLFLMPKRYSVKRYNSDGTRRCTKCGGDGPFPPNKICADGLDSLCRSCRNETSREYHHSHKEEIKARKLAYVKAWQAEHPEEVKAYHRKYNQKYYTENRERELEKRRTPEFRARFKQWRADRLSVPENRIKNVLKSAQARADRSGISKDKRATTRPITFDKALFGVFKSAPKSCVCCNIELDYSAPKRSRKNRSPSLDRIDNNGGYTANNVAIICTRCNYIKSDTTVDELKLIVAYVERELKARNPVEREKAEDQT